MILSIGGKTVTELVGSEVITYEGDKSTISRRLMCDWADAPAVCEALLGVVARVGITTLVNTPPTRHPDPKYSYMFAQRATVNGLGIASQDGLGIISYTKAIIEVEYRTPSGNSGDSEQQSTTFVTERREMGAEFMTLPKKKLYWAIADTTTAAKDSSSPLGDDARKGILVPLTHVSVDVHWWFGADARIENLTFDNNVGKVNKFDCKFLFTKWPAETLLFNGATFSRQWTTTGVSAWQVSLSFTYKRTGWNRFWWDPTKSTDGESGWWTISTDNGGRVYKRVDFIKLFMPTGYRAGLLSQLTGGAF